MRCLLALLLLALALARPAAADEFRPAYLELTQTGPETYDVLWKLPALDEATTMAVRPVFPPGTVETSPRRASFAAGTAALRWSVRVPGGLEGQALELDGLARSRIDVLARVQRSDGSVQLERIVPLAPRLVVAASPGPWEVALTYTRIGIGHILLGIDHLLFVLGLLFLVSNWKRLVATVTAFTVAHSITLAAATLGWVHVSQAPVEATIALSIMFVAAEIIRGAHGEPRLATRAPWLVAFVFGLLHGFGFAGALREVGLPQKDVPLALLFFNVGVEVGQLIFVAAAIALFSLLTRFLRKPGSTEHGPWHSEALIRTPVAYAIGTMAAFWTVQRVTGFWA